jgi:uncharacterized damage-inducible protein DinB
MTISADTIRHHLAYTAWANQRLLKAARELSADELARDFGTADKNVIGTLAHCFAAERIWLARIKEGAPKIGFLDEHEVRLEWLEENWPPLLQNWKSWAVSLADEDTDQIADYTDIKGKAWSNPLWAIVLHVVNHSTHHRGQVSGFLRAMGKTPPPLDLIFFVRENAAAA